MGFFDRVPRLTISTYIVAHTLYRVSNVFYERWLWMLDNTQCQAL